MEHDISQVERAIAVASDPSQVALHQEALSFLSSVQQNAQTTWRIALSLFLDSNPDGSKKYSNDARFFALRVIDEFLDNRFEPFDDDSFQFLQQALVAYIQSEYVYGSAEATAPFLRNKFSHTLTLFFLCAYIDKWPSFFSDLLGFIQPQDPTTQPYNPHLSILFFHILLEISGEVADQIIKSARVYSAERMQRDAKVRDLVRERDAARVNEAVLVIVSQGKERLEKGVEPKKEYERTVEVVELGIKTYASYVGWIDINLTITQSTVPLLFSLLGSTALAIRLATCTALLRVVGKGLKEPGDKLQLLKVLSLNEVLDALEAKTREEQLARKDEDDEGEESFRESLGKLLNMLGLELHKLIEEPAAGDEIRGQALAYETGLLPILLRFMADEWDDTCSTVFPFLHVVLTSYKRIRKASPAPLDETKQSFLVSLMQVVLTKMKWREDADLSDPEDEAFQEFESMRNKELRSFLESILLLDQDLVTNAIRTLVMSTFSAYQSGVPIPWNDAELAIHLVFIYGDINKLSVKGRGAFVIAPVVEKELRKTTDYAKFPLTPHGEMLMALVQCGMVNYPHGAVSLMFFETAAKYPDFFKIRKECVMQTLEAFLDNRGLHRAEDSHHRTRLHYLFHRFLRETRNDVPPDICGTLIDSVRDLLLIQVSPNQEKDDSNSTIEDPLLDLTVNDTVFESQLFLYESVGIAVSLLFKAPDAQASLLLSVYKPLLGELEESLTKYQKTPQDILVIAKIHHVIMALGNVAKGFPDFPSPVPEGYILPPIQVFTEVAQAILVVLENMQTQKVIRDATRFAFSRILATTGPNVTHLVPILMSNLLSHFEPSELVDFINFISLLIHKLQTEMFNVLDELIGPLGSHIWHLLSQPVSGTDDQRAHTETKRTYLGFLNNIMTSKLQGVFISERNKGTLESLLDTLQRLGEDISDAQASRAALLFLERAILVWGSKTSEGGATNVNGTNQVQQLPGFERVIYERIVPSAFGIPSLPQFNLKDGQALTVLHQIANLLNSLFKARGNEAYEYFMTAFLPSQGWPAEAATNFTNNLRDMDAKSFRKYFADFVRSSRSSS